MIYLMQTPDIELIAETVNSLDFSGQLIVIIILLILIMGGMSGVVIYLIRSRDKSDHLDDTQFQNQYELLKTAFDLFRESNDNFSRAIEGFKQDRVDIKKWIEIHDSSTAQRFERIKEHQDINFKEIKKLLEDKDKDG